MFLLCCIVVSPVSASPLPVSPKKKKTNRGESKDVYYNDENASPQPVLSLGRQQGSVGAVYCVSLLAYNLSSISPTSFIDEDSSECQKKKITRTVQVLQII